MKAVCFGIFLERRYFSAIDSAAHVVKRGRVHRTGSTAPDCLSRSGSHGVGVSADAYPGIDGRIIVGTGRWGRRGRADTHMQCFIGRHAAGDAVPADHGSRAGCIRLGVRLFAAALQFVCRISDCDAGGSVDSRHHGVVIGPVGRASLDAVGISCGNCCQGNPRTYRTTSVYSPVGKTSGRMDS